VRLEACLDFLLNEDAAFKRSMGWEAGMTYDLAMDPYLAWTTTVLVDVCIISFFVALVSLARLIFRSGILAPVEEDRHLSWSERKGRENARAGRLFTAPEFAPIRKTLAWSATTYVIALVSLMVMLQVFGTPS
jgi:hypothetical protein